MGCGFCIGALCTASGMVGYGSAPFSIGMRTGRRRSRWCRAGLGTLRGRLRAFRRRLCGWLCTFRRCRSSRLRGWRCCGCAGWRRLCCLCRLCSRGRSGIIRGLSIFCSCCKHKKRKYQKKYQQNTYKTLFHKLPSLLRYWVWL